MTHEHNKSLHIEQIPDALQTIKQTYKSVDADITSVLVILKEMRAHYPTTFRLHGLENAGHILVQAREKLR